MRGSVTETILGENALEGELTAGSEIAIRIDHTLTQDATETLAYLQFEALGLERVRDELAVSCVDHNMPQTGFENADDHRFLQTAAAKFGAHFSRRALDLAAHPPIKAECASARAAIRRGPFVDIVRDLPR